MNAQQEWKSIYKAMKKARPLYQRERIEWLKELYRYRREAALERKLEAAKRRIAQLEAEHNPAMAEDGNEWEKEYYLRGMHR